MLNKRVARFFIVWPPPHPDAVTSSRRDRANFYWNRDEKNWAQSYECATAYKTRDLADAEAPEVAMLPCPMAPRLQHFGRVKVIRLVVATHYTDPGGSVLKRLITEYP